MIEVKQPPHQLSSPFKKPSYKKALVELRKLRDRRRLKGLSIRNMIEEGRH